MQKNLIPKESSPEDTKWMLSVIKSIKDGEVYATINSVAKSGMSRRMSFYRVIKSNERWDAKKSKTVYVIERITAPIAWLRGYSKPGNYKQGSKYLNEVGLLVGGCGMDMIFHTLYSCMPYEQAKDWSQRYRTL